MVKVIDRAIELYDFSILQTTRTREEHQEYIRLGMTKVTYNATRHKPNADGLSEAVDIIPWPIDWNDLNRFHFLAGIMFTAAAEVGVEIVWGGDWDGDRDFTDQDFNDLPHFQLKRRT
jgi:peptidoglycan L-alanyl-D-glutamate endopeptidase CwlK